MTKIVAIRDNGTEVEVTEAVQITYDAVRQSLDWGSGFLDTEEMGHIVRLAQAAEFPDFEQAVKDAWLASRYSVPYGQRRYPKTEEEKAEAIAEYRKVLLKEDG